MWINFMTKPKVFVLHTNKTKSLRPAHGKKTVMKSLCQLSDEPIETRDNLDIEPLQLSHKIESYLEDKKKYEFEIQSLKEQTQSLEVIINEKTIELNKLEEQSRARASNLKFHVRELDQNVQLLKDESSYLQVRNENINIQIQEAQFKLHSTEKEFTELKDRENRLFSQIESLDKRLEKLLKKKDSVESNLALLDENVLSQRQTRHELQVSCNDIDHELKAKKNEYQQLDHLISETKKKELDEHKMHISHLEKLQHTQTENLIRKANDEVRGILDDAHKLADNLVNIAKDNISKHEASYLKKKMESELESQAVLSRAKEKTIQVNEFVLRKNLELDFKSKLLSDTQNRCREVMNKEIQTTIDQSQLQAQSIVEKAQKQASDIINKAHEQSDELRLQTQKNIDELNTREQKKMSLAIENEKKESALRKAKYIQELQGLKSQMQKDLSLNKFQLEESFIVGIEKIVKDHLDINNPDHHSSSPLKIDEEMINEFVRKSLGLQESRRTPYVSRSHSYKKSKSSRFMEKSIFSLLVFITFLLVNSQFPQISETVTSNFQDLFHIERTAQDMFKEDIELKRSEESHFEPILTKHYKESYVENILYTEDFTNNWLSDAFQKQWTLKVDQVFVDRLSLVDYKVIKYISDEFNFLRNLEQLRSKITSQNKDEVIKKMKSLERSFLTELEDLVEGEENLEKVLLIQQGFYTDFINRGDLFKP